jgi:hypothetical protein
MMQDPTATQCTRECVKQGSDFALVSAGKVYTLKCDNSQVDKFAGQNVTIKGRLDGKTITVNSIEAAKSWSRYLLSRIQQPQLSPRKARRPSMTKMGNARSAAAESTQCMCQIALMASPAKVKAAR